MPEPLTVAWAPFARRRALRLHRERPFDCVITTSPPESAHSSAARFAAAGVAWVADVRDAWTFEPLRPTFPTAAQRRLDERLERRWLGTADVVVCVSEPAAADLRARGIAEAVVIANGWDPPAGDRRDLGADRAARPRSDLARLHRPLRQLRPRPRPPRRGGRRLAREAPDAPARSSWSSPAR